MSHRPRPAGSGIRKGLSTDVDPHRDGLPWIHGEKLSHQQLERLGYKPLKKQQVFATEHAKSKIAITRDPVLRRRIEAAQRLKASRPFQKANESWSMLLEQRIELANKQHHIEFAHLGLSFCFERLEWGVWIVREGKQQYMRRWPDFKHAMQSILSGYRETRRM